MKKQYTAPLLTVVAVQVERGYAASDKSITIQSYDRDAMLLGGSGGHDMSEARSESGNWLKDKDDAFWGSNTY